MFCPLETGGGKGGDVSELKVLVKCPRVNLTIRDKERWTLVMRTIASKDLGEY